MTTTTTPDRDLERRLARLELRMGDVERRLGAPTAACPAPPARPAPVVAPPTPAAAPPAPPAPPARPATPRARWEPPTLPAFDLERFLGGRVLAWVGGIAVLAGLALLFALGVSSGWIGPVGRTVAGTALSLALVLAGLWLHEHRDRTEAARAAVACGAGGLFLAITVAARVYDLIPAPVGLVLAGLVAAATAVLAMRWSSPVIGALGLVGALLAPVLAGAALDLPTLAFLFVAALGATAVLLRERWTWLSAAVLVLPAAQLVDWIGDGPGALSAVVVLVAFGAVNVSAALGVDLRTRELPLDLNAAFMLGANALLLAVGGWIAIAGDAGSAAGVAWLAALATVHAAVGLLGPRGGRISRELELLALALATLIANAALALIDVGPPVKACLWALSAIGFAWLARRGRRSRAAEALLGLGVGGQVALTLVQALTVLQRTDLLGPGFDTELVVALLALASSCLISGRLAATGHPHWRIALDSCGLLATATLSLVLLDGPALTVAWAAAALALGQLAARDGDPLARGAAYAHLAGAALWCLVDQAPPGDLAGQLVEALPATVGLTAIAVAAARLALLQPCGSVERRALTGLALAAPVYLVALAAGGLALTLALAAAGLVLALAATRDGDRALGTAAVAVLAGASGWLVAGQATPAAVLDGDAGLLPAALGAAGLAAAAGVLARRWPGPPAERRVLWGIAALAPLYVASVAMLALGSGPDTGAAPSQQGQLALSALWALTGVVALVAGLRRDVRDLRVAALALLAVTIGKVFLYDLATLTAGWRIASFLALGLLLLGAGFAYQRLRPGADDTADVAAGAA